MTLFSIIISLFFSTGVNAACLDISGTYDTNYFGEQPKCAKGVPIERVWRRYNQIACRETILSTVYKLKNGIFCEEYLRTIYC